MKVIINEIEQNLAVTSVILEPNTDDPEMLKMFFCIDCGKPVIQYNANVLFIMPGPTPCSLPLFGFCHNCHKRYLFNSQL